MIDLITLMVWIVAIILTIATIYFGVQHYIFRIYSKKAITLLFIITVILWMYLLLSYLINLIKNDIFYQILIIFGILAYILFMPKDKKPKKKSKRK